MFAVSARGVRKAYGTRTALAELNLTVRAGEIYGFLGPNGAGKSTALRILTGIMPADEGEVHLFGTPLRPGDLGYRRRIGIVPEDQRMPPDMTALEYLTFFARLFEVEQPEKRAAYLLDRVRLSSHARWPAHRLSRGQQQKLSIARSLLHDPDLLLWDEPVSGLDAHGIREARDLLLEMRQAGKSLVLSSHILSEVERTADRVGILFGGRLVAEGTLGELQRRFGTGLRLEVEVAEVTERLTAGLRRLPYVSALVPDGRLLKLELADAEDRRADVSRAVVECGGLVLGIKAEAPSLEDLFLKLTPRKEGEA